MGKALPTCCKCDSRYGLKRVQLRKVFGIHTGKKNVFETKARHMCGTCRATRDGKWRYAVGTPPKK